MSSSDPDSRLLLLMRHGKAESGSSRPDHERELTDRGRSQSRLIGEYLDSQNVDIGRVLVSDAARTLRTWSEVRSQMPRFDGTVAEAPEIYQGSPAEVLDQLHDCPDTDAVVMVVGHEPTMAALVSLFADDDSDPGSVAQARIGLPTGSLGVLSGALPSWSDLDEASMTLHTIVRP